MNLSDTKAGEWSASIINLMESMNMNRTAGEEGERFDLNLLWQVIRQNRARADMRQQSSISTDTWYMVIIQVSALVIFLLLALIWRYLCRGCCPCDSLQASPEVEDVSRPGRDLPPSYSKADLFSVAVPVYDHLHPPPDYLESVASLQYLDLEPGQGPASRQSSRSSIFSSNSKPSSTQSVISHILVPVGGIGGPFLHPSPSSVLSRQSSRSSLSSSFLSQDIGRAFLRQDSGVSLSRQIHFPLQRSVSGLSVYSGSSTSSRSNSLKSRNSLSRTSTGDSLLGNVDQDMLRKLQSLDEETNKNLSTIQEE